MTSAGAPLRRSARAGWYGSGCPTRARAGPSVLASWTAPCASASHSRGLTADAGWAGTGRLTRTLAPGILSLARLSMSLRISASASMLPGGAARRGGGADVEARFLGTSWAGASRPELRVVKINMRPVQVHASLISGQVCLVSAADRLVGEVRRCGFVLDVTADGACVIAAVEAADEPQRHVDSGGDALAGDQVAINDVAGVAHHGDVTAGLEGAAAASTTPIPRFAPRRAAIYGARACPVSRCGR